MAWLSSSTCITIRQANPIVDRRFEIELFDAGAKTVTLTFRLTHTISALRNDAQYGVISSSEVPTP